MNLARKDKSEITEEKLLYLLCTLRSLVLIFRLLIDKCQDIVYKFLCQDIVYCIAGSMISKPICIGCFNVIYTQTHPLEGAGGIA